MSSSQIDFFIKIKDRLPVFENMAQSVADALGISQNEAYKKIRGLSQINISQIETLSNYFKVPFMYSGSKESTVSFFYSRIESVELYIDSLTSDLLLINGAKEKRITVITDDIPIFYLFKYPELAAFKLILWKNSLAESPEPFFFGAISPELIHKTHELNKHYLQIPTVEIWGKNSVNYTIEQIRYAWEANLLNDRNFIIEIINQLKACFQDISRYAVSGRKSIDENHKFDWYCCDVIGSMTYLAEVNGNSICYNRFSSFNVLKTQDKDYCSLIKNWKDSLIAKSTCFSRQSEKYRNNYLSSGIEKCNGLLKEIDPQS
jgi:hypothetical protein